MTTSLKQRLRAPSILLAPGVYDALSGLIAEQAGAEAIYLSGASIAYTRFGRPDIGLTTQSEMVDAVRRIAAAVDVPLIADADTGYGNALNVVRTVHEYEQAGACAIQLEDQVFPKRCGHMAGKEVIGTAEAVAKVRAAVAARQDPDLLVIARTDVGAVEGVPAAIERAKAFADAGADILFVEAPPTKADIERIATELDDHPLLFNWVEGGRTEGVDVQFVKDVGYRLIIFPISAMLAATRAMRRLYTALHETGSTHGFAEMDSFSDAVDLMGLAEVRAIEESFRS